jgi:hypothetical protein
VDLVKGTINPTPSSITNRIGDWARRAGVDAVIWTALTANFEQKTGERFSVERAVAYLKELHGAERKKAFDYIRKAPKEVRTPLRHALVEYGLI